MDIIRLKRHFPEGTLVEVRTDEEGFKGVYYTAKVISTSNASSISQQKAMRTKRQIYVEYQHIVSDTTEKEPKPLREFLDISFLRPAFQENSSSCVVSNVIEEGDMVDAFYNDGWWIGVVKRRVDDVEQGKDEGQKRNGTRFIVTFHDPPEELEFELSQLRPHFEWIDGIWFPSHKKNQQDAKQLKPGEFREKKRGRPRKMPNEIINEKTRLTGNTQIRVADDLSGKDGGDPHGTPEVVVMGTLASSTNLDAVAALNEEELTNGHSYPVIETRDSRDQITSGRKSPKKRTSKKDVKESVGRSFKTRRRQITNERIGHQAEGSFDASGVQTEDANCTMEVDKVVTEAPCHELDEEPLSKWIVGRHSTTSVTDGSRTSYHVSTTTLEQQRMENSETQRDVVVLEEPEECLTQASPPSVDKERTVPREHQSLTLPFVKNHDVLWTTIESLEVFKRIPQKPHFRPLEKHKECLREGLAVAYMVAFSRAVERASMLQLNDPKSMSDDIMETLADLETYGFDVKAVQGRVTEFLELKDKKEKLVNEAQELNDKILKHIHVKDGIEEEIRKLQSKKENEDGEIASLQARLMENEKSITNIWRSFETVSSSTL